MPRLPRLIRLLPPLSLVIVLARSTFLHDRARFRGRMLHPHRFVINDLLLTLKWAATVGTTFNVFDGIDIIVVGKYFDWYQIRLLAAAALDLETVQFFVVLRW